MDLATVDHLLTTTRSVKRRLDLTRPVEPEVIERCIEIALQAPTGSNLQGWQFMVVTDPEKRAGLADLYRKALVTYRELQEYQPPITQRGKIMESATSLRQHFHEVRVHIIPCIEGRMEDVPNLYGMGKLGSFYEATMYGSILPAAWSLMLALRARGIGSAWTTAHLVYEKEAAQVLGLPDHIIQAALLPVAYYTGTDFKPAKRLPARDLTHWNTWGQRR